MVGRNITIRVSCIDAPEIAQAPYGMASRRLLQELAPIGAKVQLVIKDRDRYGRTVADIQRNGQSINLRMVRAGQAFAYRQYLAKCDAAAYPKAEHLGLGVLVDGADAAVADACPLPFRKGGDSPTETGQGCETADPLAFRGRFRPRSGVAETVVCGTAAGRLVVAVMACRWWWWMRRWSGQGQQQIGAAARAGQGMVASSTGQFPQLAHLQGRQLGSKRLRGRSTRRWDQQGQGLECGGPCDQGQQHGPVAGVGIHQWLRPAGNVERPAGKTSSRARTWLPPRRAGGGARGSDARW
ncbi:thermonuclease family protein [Synechococcus sp. CS-1332]|nr:thermonuclease family protein [Synechococcus sp. CS-1332]